MCIPRSCMSPPAWRFLFPSRLALDVELGGVRWGGVHGVCEALVGQLLPFPTVLSSTIVVVTCAGVTLLVSPAGLCLGLPQTVAGTCDTILQVTTFSHFHRLCPHPRCFRFLTFGGFLVVFSVAYERHPYVLRGHTLKSFGPVTSAALCFVVQRGVLEAVTVPCSLQPWGAVCSVCMARSRLPTAIFRLYTFLPTLNISA